MVENLKKEISKLKREKNAIILAHFYVDGEIQDIADYVGDSLELARKAATTKADIIVFAGVHFMAETAKILSPDKKVLIPDLDSGCPLADSMELSKFKEFRKKYPDYYVINYVNSTAEIKAVSDLICTSSNAVELVQSLSADTKILFGPDRNLGSYIKRFVENEIILWQGNCPIHQNFSAEKLKVLKQNNPDAIVLAHPEANEAVLSQSDFIGSTSKIIKYAQESDKTKFIIATEPGVIHKMKQLVNDKIFIPLPPVTNHEQSICTDMKKHTLQKIYDALLKEQFEINMDKELIEKAKKPIELMLEKSLNLGLIK